MKRKWLAIIGSPQKENNTDKITDLVIEGVKKKGIKVNKVHLGDLRTLPCDGCGGCLEDGQCKILDDLTDVMEELKEADGYIFATPAYNYNVSSQMKIFIDRTFCLQSKIDNKIDKMKKSMLEIGRKAILIANSSGNKDSIGYSIEGMRKPIEELGIKVVDRIVYTNTRENPIRKNGEIKDVILTRISENNLI